MILAARAAVDRRLRVVTQDHAGLIAALNRAIDSSRGEILARMDADDVAHPRRLEAQLETLEGPLEPDVVSCLVRHFPDQEVAEGFRIYEHWLNSLVSHEAIVRERFIESPLPHPSVLVRRHCVTEIGG